MHNIKANLTAWRYVPVGLQNVPPPTPGCHPVLSGELLSTGFQKKKRFKVFSPSANKVHVRPQVWHCVQPEVRNRTSSLGAHTHKPITELPPGIGLM